MTPRVAVVIVTYNSASCIGDCLRALRGQEEVWVVDNDQSVRWVLEKALRQAHMRTRSFERGEHLLDAIENEKPDVLITDVRMPGLDGLALLERLSRTCPDLPVIVVTAHTDLENAVAAYQGGAFEYLPKPFDVDEVIELVRKAARQVGHVPGKDTTSDTARMPSLIGQAPAMQEVFRSIGRLARSSMTVLITGESGTGKELMARLIHRESNRADEPFIPVNCGAIPETLLESEFFGYMRGAFTGADNDRAGLFEAAEGGTLFLDEVGELPTALQVKLLRALQEGEIRRLGGTATSQVDVRIVSATNIDLRAAVRSGEFRQDFYYRLAVIPIHLPPLRERTEAIPDLTHHLLERLRKRLNVKVAGISPAAMKLLLAYPWPGNIRELENVLEQAVVLSEGTELAEEALSDRLRQMEMTVEAIYESDDLSVKRRSAQLERQLIQRALERTGGNRSKAGALLELSPRALRYKIQDYGLD